MYFFERPEHTRNSSLPDRKYLGERTGESQQRCWCPHDGLLSDSDLLPQKSEMHEAPQVLYVMRLLKNVMDPPANANDPLRRLPTFTTLILLHALRGIFYPSNFIYPRTARFLLQRPELDVSDVPMLFGMLYSSSDDWKKERGWMLKMLGDGMASTDDWKVLKRRHTWDLVASLFQSSKNDAAVRAGILEVRGSFA